MKATSHLLRNHAARLTAIILVLGLYGFARLPQSSASERTALAANFAFSRYTLPGLPARTYRYVRPVNPNLSRISAWISAVGAGVALNDLDDTGLPNDLCYVDTRTNQVIVAPAPGTGARSRPFALTPAPLPYNPATMAPMGCVPGDLNQDGHMDILVYYWGRTPIAFLRRQQAPSTPLSRQSYVAREVAPGGGRWYTNAVALADLDGAGHLDLVVANYFADGAHILDARATQPDHMQESMSRAFNGGMKHFFLWTGGSSGTNPTVRYHEVHGVLDYNSNHGWTLAVAACDLDGDLLPELYFANDFGPDRLLYNESTPGHLRFKLLHGDPTLSTPKSKVLGNDSFKGMGIDCGDLNGDGVPDLFVSNITEPYALQESNLVFLSTGSSSRTRDRMRNGIAPYVDRSEQLGLARSGWAWDVKLADFDNSGDLQAIQATGFVRGHTNRWPELQELAMGNDRFLSNPNFWPRFQPGTDISGHDQNPFYVRDNNGRYVNVAPELRLNEPGVSRGIAVADVYGNGNLDFAVANQWAPSSFYRNLCPHCGRYLELYLLRSIRAARSASVMTFPGHPYPGILGTPAVGATAFVTEPGGRRLMAEVDGGSGHAGKRSYELHFGLGRLSTRAHLKVELHWRDGAGHVHWTVLHLTPGSHTVVLDWKG